MPNVKHVRPLPEQRLEIQFANGETRVFNVKPYIKGSWYGKLANPDVFATVRPAGDTVVWAGGQDIAPHELYDDSIWENTEEVEPDQIALQMPHEMQADPECRTFEPQSEIALFLEHPQEQ